MSAKIFVGNLHPRTTKSELARFFSALARVEGVSIPVDEETGESRGFGFVEFADRESAEEAFSLGEGRELDGRRLRVSWAREKVPEGTERRAKWRREWERRFDGSGASDMRSGGRSRRDSSEGEDYSERRRPQRHGKHGSDRKRRHGTRREID